MRSSVEYASVSSQSSDLLEFVSSSSTVQSSCMTNRHSFEVRTLEPCSQFIKRRALGKVKGRPQHRSLYGNSTPTSADMRHKHFEWELLSMFVHGVLLIIFLFAIVVVVIVVALFLSPRSQGKDKMREACLEEH
jgi:hypothetical protein